MKLVQLAKQVADSQKRGLEMDKITLSNPELTVNQAYEIQKLSINETITDKNKFIGWKMGLTSKAKQQQVGVKEAIYGRLTSSMELQKPFLKVGELIHPRVEPEFAFLFKEELKGTNITAKDVWRAVECVFLALEVIDSRYKNFSFTLTDVVADNASSAKILLSNQAYSPYHTDWAQTEVKLYQNGEIRKKGRGEAVLDHPIHSIVELVKMIDREGLSIQSGMIVLVGGITDAVSVQADDEIVADYGDLGKLSLHVTS
ncbi:2-keto-4-pentenoate hydratase [Peribacillus sp. NPDC096540]|uniref:2-keto-4-pentenoate hydratase n=1 Tax=Peribacillus sp. NPDC096540 TaxID=3390612 RepID=UPI003CFC3B9A